MLLGHTLAKDQGALKGRALKIMRSLLINKTLVIPVPSLEAD